MADLRKAILTGVAVSGTLDLLSAFAFSALARRTPDAVLRSVASGPFGGWPAAHPVAGALAGLIVHYAIMAAMVTVFMLAARRLAILTARPILCGAAYGALLYLIMYWIVLPLRFPARFPDVSGYGIANALFSHLICVGIPMGLVAARRLRPGLARA